MKLTRDFYQRDGITLARDLLGKVLVHHTPCGVLKGRIVETEAYMGAADKAAHSYLGKPDGRVAIQYGLGGFAYIYLIYGKHCCMNIVANGVHKPECVLLRALEPIAGVEQMQANRNRQKWTDLCSGPGKLCQAMGLSREQYGTDLTGETLYLETGEREDFAIQATPRIHIDYAEEAKDFLWRFVIKDSPFLSIKKLKKNAKELEFSVDRSDRSG